LYRLLLPVPSAAACTVCCCMYRLLLHVPPAMEWKSYNDNYEVEKHTMMMMMMMMMK
jgi:hypothetical protein